MTQRKSRRLGAALLAGAMILLVVTEAASADSLSDAKAAGYIGEQADGTLGIVDAGAPSDVEALVKTTNQKRQQAYQAIAKKNGTSVQAVAARAGEKAIAKTRSGHYIRKSGGSWQKKP
jgi:hypothetical protein